MSPCAVDVSRIFVISVWNAVGWLLMLISLVVARLLRYLSTCQSKISINNRFAVNSILYLRFMKIFATPKILQEECVLWKFTVPVFLEKRIILVWFTRQKCLDWQFCTLLCNQPDDFKWGRNTETKIRDCSQGTYFRCIKEQIAHKFQRKCGFGKRSKVCCEPKLHMLHTGFL